ncbi:hypothetical protein FisN_21Hh193 [Fistulifera solaris]|jgi:hypothetical protein|uniref:Uncharacterized protein n=1 Tax=Fistulifera solaris TaxID=1519565 RepID=A0A1Z5JRV1_FISSO|nr:hypothetical protein FisN_21Hh193 [Fistulifera solaris]|eukprot:GAX16747.1 hypothetical protein FisN_21Hh193 [Fistulifera solaris]
MMFDSLDDIKLILEEDMGSEGNLNFDPMEDLDFLNDDLFTDPAPKLAPSSVSTPSFGSSSFSMTSSIPESTANATFDFKTTSVNANATFSFNNEARLPKSGLGGLSRQRQQNSQSLVQRSMSTSSMRNHRSLAGNNFSSSSNATFETKSNNPVASFLQRQNLLKEQRGNASMAKSYSMNSVRKRNFGTIDEHKPNATFDDHEPLMSRNSIASFLKAKQSGPALGRSISTSLMKPTHQVLQQADHTSHTLNAILSTHNLKKARMGSTEMNGGGNANFDFDIGSRSSTNPFMKTLSQSNSQALSSSKSSNPFMQQMGRLQTKSMKSAFVFERDNKEPSNQRGEEDIEGPMDEALLHSSCKLYHDNLAVVESALGLDPSAVRRSIPTFCSRQSNSLWKRSGKEGKYCYPLNIALYFQAPLDIIRLLANAGSDVLGFNDGPDGAGSLAIAISCHNASWPVVQLLLSVNHTTASVVDRLGNYPLHRILQSMPTEQTVTAIYEAYPEALTKRNFHGKTPLDLAVHNVTCPEAVVNALQRRSYSRMEREAQHM